MLTRSLADVIDRGGVVFSPVGFVATSSPGVQPITGAVLLGAWSFTETNGTVPAVVEIHNGNDANSGLVVTYNLSPGQSVYDYAPGDGLYLPTGLFIAVVSGTVRGSISAVRL